MLNVERHSVLWMHLDKETADKVHAEAHGHVANQMIAVDLSAVEAFLGRIQDPPSTKTRPIDDSAFRVIMFTDMQIHGDHLVGHVPTRDVQSTGRPTCSALRWRRRRNSAIRWRWNCSGLTTRSKSEP